MSRLTLICFLLLICQGLGSLRRPWMNKNLPAEERARLLLKRMTLNEKISMVHGHDGLYIGYVPAIKRLGIPALTLNDGPQGFRGKTHFNTSTQFPSLMTVAASFDTELVKEYVTAIGEEFLDKGSNILLGPGMNLARVPTSGRLFEYGAGEDPYLGREVTRTYVEKIQSMGIIATAKHYVNNEQEHDRLNHSVIIDERTAWELYYQPFMAAVEAGVLSVMCSFNKVNGVFACENNETLNTILKGKMGFKGFVMSDWLAAHSTKESALHGLDQEMPGPIYFGDALKAAVESGDVPQSVLNGMVHRILYSMFMIGIFDRPQTGEFTANVTSDAHYAVARKAAAASTVLLKNERQVLPINEKNVTTIAVLGDGALDPVVWGGGSGYVPIAHVVSALEGIRARVANTTIKVVHAGTKPFSEAVAVAESADIALVFTGVSATEELDRKNLSLPADDDALIKVVAAVNPRTVAIVTSPGAFLMPWADEVPVIIAALMPGEQFGHSITDVLFGDVNPSARLPITLPNKENEVGFTQSQYPGIELETNYTEGLFIGYRWYDQFNITPKFAFGHGLSYTTFQYDKVAGFLDENSEKREEIAILVNITNTGSVAGAEVAQLYLGYPDSAEEPPKVLRGIRKVFLQPGESVEVKFNMTNQSLLIWDVESHDWTVVPGDYKVMVGASSRDIRLVGSFKVDENKKIEDIDF